MLRNASVQGKPAPARSGDRHCSYCCVQCSGGPSAAGGADRGALEVARHQKDPRAGRSEWGGWVLEHGSIRKLAVEKLRRGLQRKELPEHGNLQEVRGSLPYYAGTCIRPYIKPCVSRPSSTLSPSGPQSCSLNSSSMLCCGFVFQSQPLHTLVNALATEHLHHM